MSYDFEVTKSVVTVVHLICKYNIPLLELNPFINTPISHVYSERRIYDFVKAKVCFSFLLIKGFNIKELNRYSVFFQTQIT